MLLAVDIGNSTISTGLFGLDGELRFLASLDTDYRKTADQICVDLMNLFQLYHFRYEDVTDSILCSVVPPLNFMMEKALTRLLGKPPVVVGPGVKTGLNIRLAVQSQVGADIVADAVSALEQFTESHEVQMAQAMVDNITRQLADIVSATRELDADCYAQRIRSYLMFSEPQMSFMQRYNVKRSVMLAALVCAVCYLGAVVQACVRRQRQRMENE